MDDDDGDDDDDDDNNNDDDFLVANNDDGEDLEMLHLDWITARPCIAWTLAATINTAAILTRMLIMTHEQKHICNHTEAS